MSLKLTNLSDWQATHSLDFSEIPSDLNFYFYLPLT